VADSTYLKTIVEPFVVSWVSTRIGLKLLPQRMPVGPRQDGTPVHFVFDGVSPDGKTALLVSAGYTVKAGGTRKLHVDASILLNAPFERRIMAFVSPDVLNNFINKCDGLLPLSRIEMIVCDELPQDMRATVELFHEAARSEVGDKGRKWRVGGQRR
jgi:hypothetical protein